MKIMKIINLKLFSFNSKKNKVTLVNTIKHKDIDSDTGTVNYISNRGVTCQIMNSNTYGNILVCFYKIDYPVKLKVAAFTIDSGNNINHLEDINLSSANNENKQVYIKSSITSDKKKALICYSAYDSSDYSKYPSFCLTFDIDSLTLGNEVQIDDNCGSSPDFINTFYFDETNEFFFICKKNIDPTVQYKIVKYDSNLKEIDINSQDEEYLTHENCYYIYSFTLIYKLNQYILISDSQCGSDSYKIKTNILPEYYITSQSSSNYINSDSILKVTTTVKDSFSSVISSSILKTSLPSILSSSSPMTTIISSSIKLPSTSISTTTSSSTNPFLSTSLVSSIGIQKTTTLYSSQNLISSSTLITSPKSTNFIPSYIITSEISSTKNSSSSTINKVKKTISIISNIPSSSYDSFKSSILSYPSTSLQSFPSSTSFIKESDKLTTYLTFTSPKTSIFYSLPSTFPKSSSFSSSLIISSNLKSNEMDVLSSVPFTTESNKNNSLIECDIISKEKKILHNDCFKSFINFNLNRIKELGKDSLIINKVSDSNIYLYELEANIEETEYNNKSLIFIQKLKLKSDLISEYNLNESENIYVLIIESPSENENSAINDYDFVFFSENGTILNLSDINYDLYSIISIPIKTLELANYEYALYFSEFGYDIYEKNDIFYKDICSSAYINNNDIVINDRKRYIFPNNVSLCLNYCIYETSDLEGKRILCNCNLNINNNSHNYNEENYFEIEEDDNNFFNYVLDKINYEIYKCYSLLYVFDNYRRKIIFYVLIIIFLIYVILIIRFFTHRIFCIRRTIINNIKKSKKLLLSKSIKKLKSSNIKNNPVKHKAKRISKNNGQTNMIFKKVNIYIPIKINQSNKIIKRKSKKGLTVNVSSIKKNKNRRK